MRYLSIDKEQIPIELTTIIEEVQYRFIFKYNASFDFFTIDLERVDDDEILLQGEKLVLDKPLFSTIGNPFERTYYIPMDLSNTVDRISYANFGERVFLYQFTVIDGVVQEDE